MIKHRTIGWVGAVALVASLLCCSAALAGPQGLIDDFSDTDLSEYTASYILEQTGVNAIGLESPSGVLQVYKNADDPGSSAGAEQAVFLRDDYTLAVNEVLRVDMSGADASDYVDFGIAVANTADPADAVWTSGTADARSGVLAIYLKPLYDSIGWLGRDGDAVPGTNVGSSSGVGVTWANVTGLYIQRKADAVFAGGYTTATNYVEMVEWSGLTDTSIGSAVGFFADLRPQSISAYGDLDNLRIVPLTPGDVDGDGDVDLDDFDIIAGNFYTAATQRSDGDLNADGIVNFADFREWKNNYPDAATGTLATLVPEPASWVLLCICGTLLLAAVRRKKAVLLCGALVMTLVAAPAALAGPVGLVDDFEDTDLSEYTTTLILDTDSPVNVSDTVWQSPSGSLELLTDTYNGGTAEQWAFIRSGITLDVGEEVQVDVIAGATGLQDIGLYVGGTTPQTNVRQDYVAMYRRNTGQLFSRGFDGTTEYGLVGNWTNDIPIDTLFITRTDTNTFEAGWYYEGARNVLATRTPTTANEADVVGFYADIRGAGTVGNLDNLRIVPPLIDGDVNGDLTVDLDDYLIIEGNLFDAVTLRSEGDLNADGIVDFLDFREWKANYSPSGTGALAGIPEPGSALLWLVGMAVIGLGCRRRNRAVMVLLVLAAGVVCCSPAMAQPPAPNALEYNTIWTNTGTGDFTVSGNWDLGVPDIDVYDFGHINNGGVATLSTTPSFTTGGIRLGVATGESGTLQIESGGNLTADENVSYYSDGSIVVGLSGTGTLSVAPGGTLTCLNLYSSGESGSTITLGGTAAGTATVSAQDVYFGRTTQVVGSSVSFSATGPMTFAETSVLQEDISGTSHSTLFTSGAATLDGALQVSFSGYTPTTSDSWDLVDAASITGGFASIELTGSTTLPTGKTLAVRTQAGGTNGTVAQLYLQQLLVLTVDRDSGAVSITNPGTSAIDLDGYGVRSTSGGLDSTGWTSLESQAIAGWAEANPSANHISELNATSVGSLGAGLSWSLGNIFSPAVPTEFGQSTEDLVFQYTSPDDDNIVGAVEYAGTGEINNLVLYVDPNTGETNLRNTSPFTVDIDGYTVASVDGALLPDNGDWLSLEDQGAEGGTWFEANGLATRVSELQVSGATTLAPNTTFNLGTLWDTTGAEDLVFEFLLSGEEDPMTGVVLYAELPDVTLVGDYNDDGVVDAADYTVWRDNVGAATLTNRDPANTGTVGEDDFLSWKTHYGETAGSGSSLSVTAVPEPASWTLLCVSGLLALAGRRSA